MGASTEPWGPFPQGTGRKAARSRGYTPCSGMEGGGGVKHTLAACPPPGREEGVLHCGSAMTFEVGRPPRTNRWALRVQRLGGDAVAQEPGHPWVESLVRDPLSGPDTCPAHLLNWPSPKSTGHLGAGSGSEPPLTCRCTWVTRPHHWGPWYTSGLRQGQEEAGHRRTCLGGSQASSEEGCSIETSAQTKVKMEAHLENTHPQS